MNFLKNYFSSMLLIGLAYMIYTRSNFHPDFISGTATINILELSFPIIWVFYTVIALYIILLVPYYLTYPYASKARLALRYMKRVMIGDHTKNEKEKTAVLAIIVKLFFIPLMLVWLTNHIVNMMNNLSNSYRDIELLSTDFLNFFNMHFFWTAFSLILFVDVLFFTL